jgi:3',5'-cyclic-AMP phosphodiesterase
VQDSGDRKPSETLAELVGRDDSGVDLDSPVRLVGKLAMDGRRDWWRSVIHLIGPGAAGKTTTGMALAENLELPFIDLDGAYMKHADIDEDITKHGYDYYVARNVDIYLQLCQTASAQSPPHTGTNSSIMRIHQITDLHVPDTDDDERFSYVRANVLKQIAFVENDRSDLLVLSGDLTMADASRQGCAWLRSVLPDMPTVVIPGNHDDPQMLWQVFGPERCISEGFYFVLKQDGCDLVFLNTCTDRLPDEQMQFLSAFDTDQLAVLFMHHPPDSISEGFMFQNQCLENHADVAAILQQSLIDHVFCGHYHNRMDKQCDGFEVHLTPSSAYQLDLHASTFSVEPFDLSVRRIDIGQGRVSTALVYI